MAKNLICLLLFCVFTSALNAQVGILPPGITPHPSAMLDVNVLPGSPKGMLIPRMQKVNRNAIPGPETGLLVFQTGPDSIGFYYYGGASWIWLSTHNTGWNINGNLGTTGSNFIGTRDDEEVRFKQNNIQAGLLDGTKLNTFYGVNTSVGALSGIRNSAFGVGALKLVSTGSENIAVGIGSLGKLNTQKRNIAIGDSAMGNFSTSSFLYSNNVVIGHFALKSPNAGTSNTLIGHQVMEMASGDRRFNTAIGDRAMSAGTGGDENVGIGLKALEDVAGGNKNVVIGSEAGVAITSGSRNMALGSRALYKQTAVSESIAIGDSALASFNSNTFSKTQNTAIGIQAMSNLTNGVANTVIGHSAMANAGLDSRYNVAIGVEALATGANKNYNIAIGQNSMENATGSNSIGIGGLAMSNGTIGDGIVGIGFRSLTTNSGAGNTAVGYQTMYINTTGAGNTALGYEALKNLGSNSGNTAIGFEALKGNTGGFNTSVGYKSTEGATTAFRNVSIGGFAHSFLTTGDENIAIGHNSDVTSGTLTNTVVIGYGMAVSTNNTVVLGNSNTNKWAFGLTTTGLAKALEVGDNVSNGNGAYLTIGGAWTNTSDVNKKEDFTPLIGEDVLKKVAELDISKWRYKGTNEYHIGPNAQNFYQLFQTGTDDKAISSIDPSGVALAAIQELIKQNESLRQELELLKIEIKKLK